MKVQINLLAAAFVFVSCSVSQEPPPDLSCEHKGSGRAGIFNIAIEGDAFFGVSDSVETYFTKSGVFNRDSEGCLALTNGMVLQGKTNGTFGNIKIPIATQSPAKATTEIVFAGNLNSETEVGSTVETVFAVYDNSGAEHILTIAFTYIGKAEWEWSTGFDDKEEIVQGSGAGRMSFGQDGTLASWLFNDNGSELKVNPRNGADTMRINFNAGGPGNFSHITQFADASTVSCTEQNGYPTGHLIALTIDEFGFIEGTYSNETSLRIAQVMLAHFANPNNLLEISDGIFAASKNSGKPSWHKPITESSSRIKIL